MKNNIFKKLIASALCLSFMTLQTTFAQTVLENGYGGADIIGSQGGYTGCDKPNSNTANLNFNGDAVLNWGHLNVGNGQSLNFCNDTFAVLNNVLNGMSIIAGSITGQTGKIIISNPNGMLMTGGGSISTAGTLVLTTQDLTGKYSFNGGNLNIDYLNNPVFKDNTYNVIALNKGSISGADINIIAKGIDVKDSNIAGKNISLVTKDGSTFFAGSNNLTFNNYDNEIKFENGNSIQVANSSIKAKNGNLELVAEGANATIDNTAKGSIESGLGSTVSAKKVTVKGGTFKGDTTLTSTVNAVEVNRGVDSKTNITDGNLTVNSKKSTTLKNIIVSGLGKGDIKVDSNQSASLTNIESNKLDVTAVGAIDVNNAKVHANANIKNTGTTSATNGNIMINGGKFDKDLNINSTKAIGINNSGTTSTKVDGNLTANSTTDVDGYNNILNVTVGKKLTAKSNSNNSIINIKANDLAAESGYYTDLINSTISNDVDVTTGKADGKPLGDAWESSRQFYMENTTVGGDLTATSETGFIHLNGGSVGGNAILNANSKGTGAKGDIVIGYNKTGKESEIKANPDKASYKNSTKIGGTITATTKNGTDTVNGMGDLLINSDNKLTISGSNVDNDLIAETKNGNLMLNGGHVKGDAKLTSGKAIGINYSGTTNTKVDGNLTANSTTDVDGYNNILNVTVGKKLTAKSNSNNSIINIKANDLAAESGYYTDLINSTISNDVDVTTGKADGKPLGDAWESSRQFYMENTSVGNNLTATSETGFIHLNGGSVGGNAILNANSKGTGAKGDIVIGYNTSATESEIKANPDKASYKNSTKIGGTITATTKNGTDTVNGMGDLLAYSDGDLTFVNSNIDNDMLVETTGKTSITDSTVNGKLNATSTNGDVYLANSKLKQTVDIKAKHDADIILNDISGHLNADAGNNINYVTRGDILLNDSTDMNLNAGNVAKITTNGDITVDNLSAGTTVVKAKTIDLKASNITTNDSTYNANVKMNSAGDVTFTGDNEVRGDLTVKTTGDDSKVAMNGKSTTADNITVDMTRDVTGDWVEIKNVKTGHLQLDNFNIGHLIESVFDSVGFNNGETLYVNILNTVVDGQIVKNLDPVIEGNRTDVNRVIYYPLSVNPGGEGGVGPGNMSSDDAARLMGYMREKGIDGLVGKDFAPIAFAAYDRGKRGAIFRAAGESIYKDVSQVVHITDRFNLDD